MVLSWRGGGAVLAFLLLLHNLLVDGQDTSTDRLILNQNNLSSTSNRCFVFHRNNCAAFSTLARLNTMGTLPEEKDAH